MNSYSYSPVVTEKLTDSSGTQHTIVNPQRFELFKTNLEAHVITMTYEMQALKRRADWIEPRLNEYYKFMEWMQRVHPDVITAYTQATKVEKTLDRANGESESVQAEASA